MRIEMGKWNTGVECFECCSEIIDLNIIDIISEIGSWVETEKK